MSSHRLVPVVIVTVAVAMAWGCDRDPATPTRGGTLVVAQLGFYALGALGLVFHVRGLGIPAGFLLAHVAVLAALARPRSGADQVWKAAR